MQYNDSSGDLTIELDAPKKLTNGRWQCHWTVLEFNGAMIQDEGNAIGDHANAAVQAAAAAATASIKEMIGE